MLAKAPRLATPESWSGSSAASVRRHEQQSGHGVRRSDLRAIDRGSGSEQCQRGAGLQVGRARADAHVHLPSERPGVMQNLDPRAQETRPVRPGFVLPVPVATRPGMQEGLVGTATCVR